MNEVGRLIVAPHNDINKELALFSEAQREALKSTESTTKKLEQALSQIDKQSETIKVESAVINRTYKLK